MEGGGGDINAGRTFGAVEVGVIVVGVAAADEFFGIPAVVLAAEAGGCVKGLVADSVGDVSAVHAGAVDQDEALCRITGGRQLPYL